MEKGTTVYLEKDWALTTERPASRGNPVLKHVPSGLIFRPADIVKLSPRTGYMMAADAVVYLNATCRTDNPDAERMIKQFVGG